MRSALKTCAVAGTWQVARALLEMAEGHDGMASLGWAPDKTMYDLVIETCISAGQPREALALLERMPAAGLEVQLPTIYTYLVVFLSVWFPLNAVTGCL